VICSAGGASQEPNHAAAAVEGDAPQVEGAPPRAATPEAVEPDVEAALEAPVPAKVKTPEAEEATVVGAAEEAVAQVTPPPHPLLCEDNQAVRCRALPQR